MTNRHRAAPAPKRNSQTMRGEQSRRYSGRLTTFCRIYENLACHFGRDWGGGHLYPWTSRSTIRLQISPVLLKRVHSRRNELMFGECEPSFNGTYSFNKALKCNRLRSVHWRCLLLGFCCLNDFFRIRSTVKPS